MRAVGIVCLMLACLLGALLSPSFARAEIRDNLRCGPIVDNLSLENNRETLLVPLRAERLMDVRKTMPTLRDVMPPDPDGKYQLHELGPFVQKWRALNLRCLMKVRSTLAPAIDAGDKDARLAYGVLFLGIGSPYGPMPTGLSDPGFVLDEAHDLLVDVADTGDELAVNWLARFYGPLLHSFYLFCYDFLRIENLATRSKGEARGGAPWYYPKWLPLPDDIDAWMAARAQDGFEQPKVIREWTNAFRELQRQTRGDCPDWKPD